MGETLAFIQGLGMLTPVGGSAAQTAASVRAGISAYQDSSIHNRNFKPMTLALVPEESLPPLHEGLEPTQGLTSREIRMLRLAQPALEEAAGFLDRPRETPLFLATPEPGPSASREIGDEFLDYLAIQSDHLFLRAESAVFPAGRAGGMLALQAAFEHLQGGNTDALVGGVDTYLDLHLLSSLDMEDRILAEGIMDGFAPGEGAAFIVLSSNERSDRGMSSEPVQVHRPGVADEEGHRYSDKPYRGDGLANAMRLAIDNAKEDPISTVFSSLNGENFGAKEWGVALTRNKSHFVDATRLEHPADCLGDCGAACGPLLIGLAATGLTKQYLQSPLLVYCSSETENRGAAVISHQSH